MSRVIKSKRLKVISVCSECGEPVMATGKDTAYRHGYNRHVVALGKPKKGFRRRLQEDSKPCKGSGQPVIYKRRNK